MALTFGVRISLWVSRSYRSEFLRAFLLCNVYEGMKGRLSRLSGVWNALHWDVYCEVTV